MQRAVRLGAWAIFVGWGIVAGACSSTQNNSSTRNTNDGSLGDGGSVPAESRADIFAQAAVVIGSCMPDDGINRNLADLWYDKENPQLWGNRAPYAGCLAAANSGCDATAKCLGITYTPSTASCATTCNGSILRVCGDGIEITLDCSRIGLNCDMVAACSAQPASNCDTSSYVANCDAAGFPYVCDGSRVVKGINCASLGLVCQAGYCVGKGVTCSQGSKNDQGIVDYYGTGCVGADLVACVNGATHTVRCADAGPGFSCQQLNDVYFCGLAAECVPGEVANSGSQASTPVTCDGSTVVLCNAGRIDRIDCKSLGFDSCDVVNARGCVPAPL